MILLVDDHNDSRRALARLLELDGHEVVCAASGSQALLQLESIRPHCVILDYHMPDMDGLDVLKRIRADGRFGSLRVIMFTAAGPAFTPMAMAAGADAVVEKCSLDFAELKRQVLKCCVPEKESAPVKPRDARRRNAAG